MLDAVPRFGLARYIFDDCDFKHNFLLKLKSVIPYRQELKIRATTHTFIHTN